MDMGMPRLAWTGISLAFLAAVAGAADKPPVVWRPASPANFQDASRTAADIDSIVIHTAEGSYAGTISWFQNPSASASSHYVISPSGEITQMVADEDVAWTQTYYNRRSFGIECAGYAGSAATWTPELLDSLVSLVAWLSEAYQIRALHPATTANDTGGWYDDFGILGHYQIQTSGSPAATRYGVRTDPGSYFPWDDFVARVNGQYGPGVPSGLVAEPRLEGARAAIRFSWDPAAGADGYWLDIATDPGELQSMTGSFRNFNLGGTSHDWQGLEPGTVYYWRVFAYNAYGGVHGYPAGPVTTPSAGPPDAPALLSPPDGSTVTSWPVILDWNDPPGATSYDVEIGRIEADGSYTLTHQGSTGVSSYSVPVGAAPWNATHVWKVRAVGPSGTSDASEASFTLALPAPAKPSILSPKDWERVSTNTPTLRWDHGDTPAIWWFEIRLWRWNGSSWTEVWRKEDIGGASGEFVLPDGAIPRTGWYWWAVRIWNPGGYSPWAGSGFGRW